MNLIKFSINVHSDFFCRWSFSAIFGFTNPDYHVIWMTFPSAKLPHINKGILYFEGIL
jgi:hypothetical protein